MKGSRWLLLILCAFSFTASAQQRRVAITIDDLPYVSHTGTALTPADLRGAREANHQLLRALKEHRVPVTGFVNEGRVQGLGANSGVQILRQWIAEDLDLGNHAYSHPDINRLSVAQIEDEILRGEATIAPLMKETGKRVEFFRFPMNHTGDNKAKHDAIAAFLAKHGYKLATCTIENSDYLLSGRITWGSAARQAR